MKKISTFLIVAFAVFASGCSSNSLNEVDDPHELVFNVAVTPFTKSAADLRLPSDSPMGVWSFTSDGKSFLDNEKVCCDNQGMWLTESRKMWSNGVGNLDFIAYSPYGRGDYRAEDGICYDAYDITEGLDLMYSEPLKDQNKDESQGTVTVNMQRALANVNFMIKAIMQEGSTIVVKKLDVTGAYGAGSFRSLPQPYWTNLSSYRSFCFFEGEHDILAESSVLGEGLCMIPQTSEITITLTCDLYSGDSILTDQIIKHTFVAVWNPGKIATHTIKINRQLDITIEKINE